jgi:hypothetical protein
MTMSSITIKSRHELIEIAKAKVFADGAFLSTVQKALRALKPLDAVEIAESTVVSSMIKTIHPNEKGTSPTNATRLAYALFSPLSTFSPFSIGDTPMTGGGDSTRKCNATASLQASKDIAAAKLEKAAHTLEIIESLAKRNGILLALIEGKLEENLNF